MFFKQKQKKKKSSKIIKKIFDERLYIFPIKNRRKIFLKKKYWNISNDFQLQKLDFSIVNPPILIKKNLSIFSPFPQGKIDNFLKEMGSKIRRSPSCYSLGTTPSFGPKIMDIQI